MSTASADLLASDGVLWPMYGTICDSRFFVSYNSCRSIRVFLTEGQTPLPRSSGTRPVDSHNVGTIFTPIKTSSSHTRWLVHSSVGSPADFFIARTVLTRSTILTNTSEYVVRPPRRCKKTAASQKANSRQKANQSRGRRIRETSQSTMRVACCYRDETRDYVKIKERPRWREMAP